MNHQFNNLNSSNYPISAILNQQLNNQRGGMVYRVQRIPPHMNRQIHAQQGAAIFLQRNQSNSIPSNSTNNSNSINNYSINGNYSMNNNSFLLGNDLLTQQQFNMLQDNNNIRNNVSFNNVAHPTLNFPRLSESSIFNSAQRVNVSVPRSEPSMLGGTPYDPKIDSPEKNGFKMSSKDFPELPQSSNNSVAATDVQWNTKSSVGMTKLLNKNKTKSLIVGQNDEKPDVTIRRPNVTNKASVVNDQSLCDAFSRATTISQTKPEPATNSNNQNTKPKIGVQTFPDGKITNIPDGMIRDQYGLLGLLVTMKTAETDPNLTTLNFGEDLTALGLNLNSPDDLLPTFAGALADYSLQPQDLDPYPDFTPIPEYKLKGRIGFKLGPFNESLYKEDLLFYLFYKHAGNKMQLKAAQELRARGWRYHMEYRAWLICQSEKDIVEKTDSFERGTYQVFDVQSWRKVLMNMVIVYSQLEEVTKEEDISIELPDDPPLDREWIESIGFSRRNK